MKSAAEEFHKVGLCTKILFYRPARPDAEFVQVHRATRLLNQPDAAPQMVTRQGRAGGKSNHVSVVLGVVGAVDVLEIHRVGSVVDDDL